MKHMTLPGLAALVLSAGLLSACGGGGGYDAATPEVPPVADSVPGAIANSVDALIAFAKGLATDDTAEPLLLGTVVPATDDTGEPAAL
jgi:hypothetical protein